MLGIFGIIGIRWAIFIEHILNKDFRSADGIILLDGELVNSDFDGLKWKTWIFMILVILDMLPCVLQKLQKQF